jgi:hypothetical protein
MACHAWCAVTPDPSSGDSSRQSERWSGWRAGRGERACGGDARRRRARRPAWSSSEAAHSAAVGRGGSGRSSGPPCRCSGCTSCRRGGRWRSTSRDRAVAGDGAGGGDGGAMTHGLEWWEQLHRRRTPWARAGASEPRPARRAFANPPDGGRMDLRMARCRGWAFPPARAHRVNLPVRIIFSTDTGAD